MNRTDSDLSKKLFSSFQNMTKREKIIADYIIIDENNAQTLTITELAERCGVGEATVTRFCKKIGYSGYNEFKLALAQSLNINSGGEKSKEIHLYDKSIVSNISYQNAINAIKRTYQLLRQEDIDYAVKLMCESKKISCMGQGSSLVMAMEMWSRFSILTNKFVCVQDFVYQAISATMMDKNDLIVYLSYSGSTTECIEVLKEAKKKNVKIILMTGHVKSPATKYADVILVSGVEESPLNQGAVTTRISFLAMIDVLFNEYYNIDVNTNNERTETSLKTTHKRML